MRFIAAALFVAACGHTVNACAGPAESIYFVTSIGSVATSGNFKTDLDHSLSSAGVTNFQSSVSNGVGYRLLVGYELSSNFAIEGGYLNLGTMTYGVSMAGTNLNVDLKPTAFNIAAIGVVPVSKDILAFGKLGYTAAKSSAKGTIGTSSFEPSQDSSSGGYGVGVIYKLYDKVGIRAEWEQVYSDMSMFSVGLHFKF